MFVPHVLSSFLQWQQTYSNISSVSRDGEQSAVILALIRKERDEPQLISTFSFLQIETDSIEAIKINCANFAMKFFHKTLVELDS